MVIFQKRTLAKYLCLILFLNFFTYINKVHAQSLLDQIDLNKVPDIEQGSELKWEPLPLKTLTTRIGFYSPGADFSIQRSKEKGLTYIPGVSNGPYLDVSYGKFGLSYHQALPPTEEEKRNRGESQFNDAQFRFFGHRNSVEFLYQRVSGFVLQNWDLSAPESRRPDITTTSYQINFLQTLSPSYFSNSVTYNLDGYQLKPGASAIALISVGHFSMRADQGFAPSYEQQNFGDSGQSKKSTTQYALFGLGYGGIYPTSYGFFMSLTGYAGYGMRFLNYQSDSFNKSNLSSTYRLGLRPALGFNKGPWLAVFSLLVDGTNWQMAESNFQQAGYALKFVIGYRFQNIF